MEEIELPELSVIVTVVEGDPALTRCLQALRNQIDPPSLEIIVPFDDTVPQIRDLGPSFPEVRFLALGSLGEVRRQNAFTQHELFDRRRAGGLRVAQGKLIAMLEDRGEPQLHWSRTMVDLHRDPRYAAIGGALENASSRSIEWALFFCDFGRFQPPVEQSDPEYISDINICYKQEALESVRNLWNERYQEATVNWALRRSGRHLLLSDRPLVVQNRRRIDLRSVLAERIHWGRVFGQARGAEASPLRCLLWAAVTPALPVVLFIRHFRRELHRGRNVREFIRAVPATFVLLHFWVLGELIGYCESAQRRTALDR